MKTEFCWHNARMEIEKCGCKYHIRGMGKEIVSFNSFLFLNVNNEEEPEVQERTRRDVYRMLKKANN